jgi:hypothetical protein
MDRECHRWIEAIRNDYPNLTRWGFWPNAQDSFEAARAEMTSNGAIEEASVGVTLCYASGEGAGPQAPSEYSLIASRHEREGGIFRIDMRTGLMSICYVMNDAVVCTPPAK